MNCQPTTITIAVSAPDAVPRMLRNGSSPRPIPTYGSNNRLYSNAIAAVDSSSGRKNSDDSTARLRCSPAAHTPIRIDSGVCVAQQSTVSSSVVQVTSQIASLLNRRGQLFPPQKAGVPTPVQSVNDRDQ